jgi:hypothetical protein
VAVTVAERYTDADVELVADVLWRYPSKTTTRAAATSVLDALVAAGWAPRRAMAKEFADALHAYIARSPWMSPAYRDGTRDAAQYAWPPFAAAEDDAAHRRQVAEEIAQAIQERCAGSHLDLGDGPPDDCEHQRYAALARAHGEAGHG